MMTCAPEVSLSLTFNFLMDFFLEAHDFEPIALLFQLKTIHCKPCQAVSFYLAECRPVTEAPLFVYNTVHDALNAVPQPLVIKP